MGIKRLDPFYAPGKIDILKKLWKEEEMKQPEILSQITHCFSCDRALAYEGWCTGREDVAWTHFGHPSKEFGEERWTTECPWCAAVLSVSARSIVGGASVEDMRQMWRNPIQSVGFAPVELPDVIEKAQKRVDEVKEAGVSVGLMCNWCGEIITHELSLVRYGECTGKPYCMECATYDHINTVPEAP